MKVIKVLNLLAGLLILVGLVIFFFIFSPVLIEEANYQVKKIYPPSYRLIDDPEKVAEAKKEASVVYREKLLIPQSFDFSLVIPKIGVNEKVFPEVNSADEEEYLAILKEGLAHAKGSSLPDERGVVFIFGHSTDSFYNIAHYNASFFLLRKLEPGDDIYVFYEDRKHHCQVKEKRVVDPERIEEELTSLKGNWLVLQTCSPPGTTLKRLLVLAQPVD